MHLDGLLGGSHGHPERAGGGGAVDGLHCFGLGEGEAEAESLHLAAAAKDFVGEADGLGHGGLGIHREVAGCISDTEDFSPAVNAIE